jgi:hypothetical protein
MLGADPQQSGPRFIILSGDSRFRLTLRRKGPLRHLGVSYFVAYLHQATESTLRGEDDGVTRRRLMDRRSVSRHPRVCLLVWPRRYGFHVVCHSQCHNLSIVARATKPKPNRGGLAK